VTRLQANLSRAALVQDLILKPSPTQDEQKNWFRAQNGTSIPCKV
jgi:hypothetical protein